MTFSLIDNHIIPTTRFQSEQTKLFVFISINSNIKISYLKKSYLGSLQAPILRHIQN